MKTKIVLILAVLGCSVPASLRAAEEKTGPAGHEHTKKEAGPNGGRIVTSTDPHFEFFVTPERKIKITFLGADNKPVPAKDQKLTLVGGERSAPTKMTFAKEGDALVSDKPLPDGKIVPVILQVKASPEAKAVTERFSVNLEKCPTCEHPEYACTCEHAGEDEHDH